MEEVSKSDLAKKLPEVTSYLQDATGELGGNTRQLRAMLQALKTDMSNLLDPKRF